MKRKDVTELINACDAGREGELIFRYIVQFSKVDKPVRRLWMQSMTDNAIREAFAKLRDGAAMKPLSDAAYCRSESDWLVGINSTRAMTAFNSKFGGFNKTPVGRVQTPTLALLAEREQEIDDFVSEDYFEVHGTFDVKAGEYLGRWFDESFKKSEDKPHARAERIWDKESAEAIVARYDGSLGDRSAQDRAFADKMAIAARHLQRNANVLVIYADALMNLQPWDYWEADAVTPKGQTAEILATLDQALQIDPDHPGALHLQITHGDDDRDVMYQRMHDRAPERCMDEVAPWALCRITHPRKGDSANFMHISDEELEYHSCDPAGNAAYRSGATLAVRLAAALSVAESSPWFSGVSICHSLRPGPRPGA